MTEGQKKKLEILGVEFGNTQDHRWNRLYELAKKYYEHYGHLKIRINFITSDGYTYDEVKRVNYNGELTFVPTRIGAYMIKCTVTSSVSERSAENTTIITVASEPNVVEVPSKWLQNNVWSIVFLSIGTLSLIGIIILLCIKPKEQTDND